MWLLDRPLTSLRLLRDIQQPTAWWRAPEGYKLSAFWLAFLPLRIPSRPHLRPAHSGEAAWSQHIASSPTPTRSRVAVRLLLYQYTKSSSNLGSGAGSRKEPSLTGRASRVSRPARRVTTNGHIKSYQGCPLQGRLPVRRRISDKGRQDPTYSAGRSEAHQSQLSPRPRQSVKPALSQILQDQCHLHTPSGPIPFHPIASHRSPTQHIPVLRVKRTDVQACRVYKLGCPPSPSKTRQVEFRSHMP